MTLSNINVISFDHKRSKNTFTQKKEMPETSVNSFPHVGWPSLKVLTKGFK